MFSESGNEYAQLLGVQLPDSSRLWVANLYIPPEGSLRKRKVKEAEAREHAQAILEEIPPQDEALVVGDLNARVGSMSPEVKGESIPRTAMDAHVC